MPGSSGCKGKNASEVQKGVAAYVKSLDGGGRWITLQWGGRKRENTT